MNMKEYFNTDFRHITSPMIKNWLNTLPTKRLLSLLKKRGRKKYWHGYCNCCRPRADISGDAEVMDVKIGFQSEKIPRKFRTIYWIPNQIYFISTEDVIEILNEKEHVQ